MSISQSRQTGIRVLSVTQGAPAGIGRVEILLDRTWRALQLTGSFQVHSIRKLDPPDYLPREEFSSRSSGGNRLRLARWALTNWLVRKPDVVLFSHVNLCPLGLPMRALRPTTKIAVLIYGDDAWGRMPRLRSLALSRADAVWSISEYTRDVVVQEYGLSPAKVRVLPLCLTAERLDELNPNVDGTKPTYVDGSASILTVARLDPANKYKGVDHVLKAMPAIAQSIPNVDLTVVGDGPDRTRLETLADDLGIRPRVHFRGAIGDDELTKAYKQCDVFTLPSAQEGFGLVYIEAMAAGKPVVAVNACATPEVVVPDRTGLLVSYGDVPALADRLTTLLINAQLRSQMGRSARKWVEEKFTFQRFAGHVAELLNEICVDNSASRGADK